MNTVIDSKYVIKKIYKVLGSCTNRFQYLTAVKYLDRLICIYETVNVYNIAIDILYNHYKYEIYKELNDD